MCCLSRGGQTKLPRGPGDFKHLARLEETGHRAIDVALLVPIMEIEKAQQLGFAWEIVKRSKVLQAALDVTRRVGK